jgi:hypothetical protein
MRALSIVHESTGRRLVREFYPMRFIWWQAESHKYSWPINGKQSCRKFVFLCESKFKKNPQNISQVTASNTHVVRKCTVTSVGLFNKDGMSITVIFNYSKFCNFYFFVVKLTDLKRPQFLVPVPGTFESGRFWFPSQERINLMCKVKQKKLLILGASESGRFCRPDLQMCGRFWKRCRETSH